MYLLESIALGITLICFGNLLKALLEREKTWKEIAEKSESKLQPKEGQ